MYTSPSVSLMSKRAATVARKKTPRTHKRRKPRKDPDSFGWELENVIYSVLHLSLMFLLRCLNRTSPFMPKALWSKLSHMLDIWPVGVQLVLANIVLGKEILSPSSRSLLSDNLYLAQMKALWTLLATVSVKRPWQSHPTFERPGRGCVQGRVSHP